jgi:hypothetical protein
MKDETLKQRKVVRFGRSNGKGRPWIYAINTYSSTLRPYCGIKTLYIVDVATWEGETRTLIWTPSYEAIAIAPTRAHKCKCDEEDPDQQCAEGQ